MRSKCCGTEVKIIRAKMGNDKEWVIPKTWGYVCSKCNKLCQPEQGKGGKG